MHDLARQVTRVTLLAALLGALCYSLGCSAYADTPQNLGITIQNPIYGSVQIGFTQWAGVLPPGATSSTPVAAIVPGWTVTIPAPALALAPGTAPAMR